MDKPHDSTGATVLVSGCFDGLHSGHIAFLESAARFGGLVVALGSDKTILNLKQRRPIFQEQERLRIVQSLRCVQQAFISKGNGILDFEAELRACPSNYFVVNEDGDHPSKRELCQELGIEYRVLRRLPIPTMPERSSSLLRSAYRIPHRIEICGGWLDQPVVSRLQAGSVIVASIYPLFDVQDRMGLATSTYHSAEKLWGSRIATNLETREAAKLLFSYENPPGTIDVAGSQDAYGIVFPGLNKLAYSGGYLPFEIETILSDETLTWLENVIQLIPLPPRESDYDPYVGSNINRESAQRLMRSSEACWSAIVEKNAGKLGAALTACLEAQLEMFPAMMNQSLRNRLQNLQSQVAGAKFSGAGGGGYLVAISEKKHPNACQFQIRRSEWS